MNKNDVFAHLMQLISWRVCVVQPCPPLRAHRPPAAALPVQLHPRLAEAGGGLSGLRRRGAAALPDQAVQPGLRGAAGLGGLRLHPRGGGRGQLAVAVHQG